MGQKGHCSYIDVDLLLNLSCGLLVESFCIFFWILVWEMPTLLIKRLRSSLLIFSYSLSYMSRLYWEKSVWQISMFRRGYLYHNFLLSSSNLVVFLETKITLKPSYANSKQKARPIPSVQPVTSAHDPWPYFSAHLVFNGVNVMRRKVMIAHRALKSRTDPISMAK